MRFILQAAIAVAVMVAASGPATAIVGGSEGGQGQASAVMVLTDRGGICTGVVVAQDAVLTAAHCVAAGAQIRVHYREQGAPILLEAALVVRHPGYRANAVAERARSIDLALIRTAPALPARFSPAALASRPSAGAGGLFVAGYGLSAEGDASTAGVWRGVQLGQTQPYGPSRVLYWLGGGPGVGACQGDSGGPAFDGAGLVTGLVSWTTGAGRAKCGVLTQAVILAPQRGWIDATLAIWGRSAIWR